MRRTFEMATISQDFLTDATISLQLIQAMNSNPGWLTQIEWLKEKTTSPLKNERELSWQILTTLMEKSTTSQTQIEQITS